MPRSELNCSFCGKGESEVKRMIAGPCAFICNECHEIIGGIFEEEGIPKSRPVPIDFDAGAVHELQRCLLETERAIVAVSGDRQIAFGLRKQVGELSGKLVALRRASIRDVKSA